MNIHFPEPESSSNFDTDAHVAGLEPQVKNFFMQNPVLTERLYVYGVDISSFKPAGSSFVIGTLSENLDNPEAPRAPVLIAVKPVDPDENKTGMIALFHAMSVLFPYNDNTDLAKRPSLTVLNRESIVSAKEAADAINKAKKRFGITSMHTVGFNVHVDHVQSGERMKNAPGTPADMTIAMLRNVSNVHVAQVDPRKVTFGQVIDTIRLYLDDITEFNPKAPLLPNEF